MRLGVVATGLVLAMGGLLLPASSRARSAAPFPAAPFTLTAQKNTSFPDVAVDTKNVGHFTWIENVAGATYNDVLHYCQIPRGQTSCKNAKTFALKGENEGGSRVVIGPTGAPIVLLAYVQADRRPVPNGTSNNVLLAYVSTDGGATFTEHVVGTIDPWGDAQFGPGDDQVSVITHQDSRGTLFQAALLGSYVSTAANVGEGGTLRSHWGSVGYVRKLVPITAFADADKVYYRVSKGTGDYNSLSTWEPTRTLGPGDQPKLASGLAGVFLLYSITKGHDHQYVVRALDKTTETFGPATPISDPGDPIERQFVEDTSNHLIAVWIVNSENQGHVDPIMYRASPDGGTTWNPIQTIVTQTSNHADNLRLGAGADGGGWLVWDSGTQGPLNAVPLPPVGKAGGGGKPGCPQTIKFGEVEARASQDCFHKQGASYTTTKPARINGLDLDPGGLLTITPGTGKIVGTGMWTVSLGKVELEHGPFTWPVPPGSVTTSDAARAPAKGPAKVTTFTNLEQFGKDLFGFPLVGTADLQFQNGTSIVPAHVGFEKAFGGVTGSVTLHGDNPTPLGLHLEGLAIHVDEVPLGLLTLRCVDITYSGNGNNGTFDGSGAAYFPPQYANLDGKCKDAPLQAAFEFQGGKFTFAALDVGFPNPAFPSLFPLDPPELYLSHVGFGLQLKPVVRVSGGVDLVAGGQLFGVPVVEIKALPSNPTKLKGCPSLGFCFSFGKPAELRAAGELHVVSFKIADGFVDFRTDGKFSFGGEVDYAAGSIASVKGGVKTGFLDLSTGKFGLDAEIQGCIPADCAPFPKGFSGDADFLIGDQGVAICIHGGGARLSWSSPIPEPFGKVGGCDYTVVSSAAAAVVPPAFDDALPGPLHATRGDAAVTLPAGLPRAAFAVEGTAGPPLVKVVAPSGESVTSSPAGTISQTAHLTVYPLPGTNYTQVLLVKPPAGTYTITQVGGTSAVANVYAAKGLPAPSIKARVTGKGIARKLVYTIASIPGQKVTFAERSTRIFHELGTATGPGSIRFLPADGPAEVRQIVALVFQDGFPRKQLVVASYRSPAPLLPTRPKFVKLTRRGSAVRLAWGPADFAARYEVRTSFSDGRRSYLSVSADRPHGLTIPRVAATVTGTATVRGLSSTGQAGPALGARLTPARAR
jgi:hypothetical protein